MLIGVCVCVLRSVRVICGLRRSYTSTVQLVCVCVCLIAIYIYYRVRMCVKTGSLDEFGFFARGVVG